MRFIQALIACTAGLSGAAGAQEPGRVYRLGLLSPSTLSFDGFRAHSGPELAKLGFIEGQNLVLLARAGSAPELPNSAHELVALKPDAIVAVSSQGLAAAKAATDTIPIITYGPDPVAQGFAQSHSRPGGNVTGVAILGGELDGKRLELMRQAVPSAKRIAFLVHPSNAEVEGRPESIRAVAHHSGIDLVVQPASGLQDYASAFDAIRSAGAEALVIAAHPTFYLDAAVLARSAREAGLPTTCQWREMAQAGCLLGYGPNQPELRRRIASYVARILLGEKPSGLPVEQPMKVELVVNLRTARELRLQLTETILARADEVLE